MSSKLIIYVYNDDGNKMARKPFVLYGFKEQDYRNLILDLNSKTTKFVCAYPLLLQRGKIHHIVFEE